MMVITVSPSMEGRAVSYLSVKGFELPGGRQDGTEELQVLLAVTGLATGSPSKLPDSVYFPQFSSSFSISFLSPARYCVPLSTPHNPFLILVSPASYSHTFPPSLRFSTTSIVRPK